LFSKLTSMGGTGDRIRTNDTPGMKFSELKSISASYYYRILKKEQHLDIVIYSYRCLSIIPHLTLFICFKQDSII